MKMHMTSDARGGWCSVNEELEGQTVKGKVCS